MFARYWVEHISHDKIFTASEIPGEYMTIVVLGTAPKLANGRGNLFFYHRIQAVSELMNSGEYNKILVSGDNGRKNYNEPEAMKQALIKEGIPSENIELDYAGFRTLDSVVRARDVFGAEPFVIVSQRFHIERALAIAHAKDINMVGYAAKNVALNIAPRVYVREILARGWMILDLYIFGTKPKFEE